MDMERDENYLDNLNLDLKTQIDIEELFKEWEEGRLEKSELICCLWLSMAMIRSKGFSDGFKSAEKRYKKTK